MADSNAASPRVPDPSYDSDATTSEITITITHRNIPYTFDFDPSATLADLSNAIADQMSIPHATQKLLIPKHGLQKPPFANPLPLSPLQSTKIQLLAPPPAELASLHAASELASARAASRAAARRARPSASARPTSNPISTLSSSSSSSSTYTFLTVRPLPFLPRPEQSLALLNRLKADPGIRASMAKHAFTVQLLTEMEPLANTSSTHEGTTRLLGLNRNKGEVIELRLRTDAHDGYRDYKTIRRTLCHELAHNVHSDHDKDFWALCRHIEREVEAGSGGHTIGGGGYTAPARGGDGDEDEDVDDHGGWQGGEFVVGGGSAPSQGLSRREILAKAAEERLKRMNMDRPDGGRPDSGPSS